MSMTDEVKTDLPEIENGAALTEELVKLEDEINTLKQVTSFSVELLI